MDEDIIYKIEILKLIESHYAINIMDEEVERIATLHDLVNLVREKHNSKNQEHI